MLRTLPQKVPLVRAAVAGVMIIKDEGEIMRKLYVGLPLIFILSGCTFYNVNDVGENTYEIKGHASSLKSKSAILEDMKKKATKVCDGEEFEILDPATHKINPNYTGGIANESQTMSIVVKCKS